MNLDGAIKKDDLIWLHLDEEMTINTADGRKKRSMCPTPKF